MADYESRLLNSWLGVTDISVPVFAVFCVFVSLLQSTARLWLDVFLIDTYYQVSQAAYAATEPVTSREVHPTNNPSNVVSIAKSDKALALQDSSGQSWSGHG